MYPLLDKDDKRWNMTKFSTKCEDNVHDLIEEYHEAFGLWDETETCPNVEVHFLFCDELPFFLFPYVKLLEEQ